MSGLDQSVVEHSREMIDQGSKSFGLAARLFEPSTRAGAFMLYAWCRYCDDVIDGQELGMNADPVSPAEAARRLKNLQERTDAAIEGHAVSPEFQALKHVVYTYKIPAQFPHDLLDGFAMDAGEHFYRTEEDLLTYCYHVAGAVGVMMTYVMGATDTPTLKRANDLGIAFQLTNIARDLVPDAELNRVYIPSDWLEVEGILAKPSAVMARENRVALGRVAKRLIMTADTYYASAAFGLSHLPMRCAWAIATALDVYRQIGYQVVAAGPKAWDTRVSVSKPRKLLSVFGGLGSACMSRLGSGAQHGPSRDHLWTPPALRNDQ
jgi:phytoene synthase